jgi:hypothetical protein
MLVQCEGLGLVAVAVAVAVGQRSSVTSVSMWLMMGAVARLWSVSDIWGKASSMYMFHT